MIKIFGNFFAIVVCAILLVFMPVFAVAGTYTASAHGNSGYGVKRNTMPSQYARGNCAHCHEQHSSVNGAEPTPVGGVPSDYLLFNDPDTVCFACHGGTLQNETIVNNNYAATFGGAEAESITIMAAFNQNSSHNLDDIKSYITGDTGTKLFADFNASASPCSGCHNVHIAEANKRSTSDIIYTAMSRPTDHGNLWGDVSTTERMTIYDPDYQPPNRVGGGLEPDGNSSDKTIQAAKTPDYIEFCTDCHNSSNIIESTTLGRPLKTINWDLEKHGKAAADGYISVDAPYTAGSGDLGYVLSCTDCHEPHGSSNKFLIRKDVNGTTLSGTISSDSDWQYLCNRCHDDNNEIIHHYSSDKAYVPSKCGSCHFTIGYGNNCARCHYHGSWVNDPNNSLDITPNTGSVERVTF